MLNNRLFFLLLIILLSACTEEFTLNPNSTQSVVVQAFLYSGEPVDDIRLISTLSLTGSDSSGLPINTATVTLLRNNVPYKLSLTDQRDGTYHYPGDDLHVEPGDHFRLEATVGDDMVTAETTVPKPPRLQSDDALDLIIQKIDPAEVTDSIKKELEAQAVLVFWDRTIGSQDFYFAKIENIEEHPRQLLVKALDAPAKPAITETPLFSDNRLEVGFRDITHTGQHRVTVYHVDRTYADLYFSNLNPNQRRREITESITNVKNGLGIFTAFASAYKVVTVVEK